MVALRICGSVCASAEQLPKKAFLSRRFQSHLITIATPHQNRHNSSHSSHLITIVTPHHNRHTSSQSSHLITIDVFYSAQQITPFIVVHGTVKNVMKSPFNIKNATGFNISWKLCLNLCLRLPLDGWSEHIRL